MVQSKSKAKSNTARSPDPGHIKWLTRLDTKRSPQQARHKSFALQSQQKHGRIIPYWCPPLHAWISLDIVHLCPAHGPDAAGRSHDVSFVTLL